MLKNPWLQHFMRSIVLSDVVSQMVHYFSEDFDIEEWLETAP